MLIVITGVVNDDGSLTTKETYVPVLPEEAAKEILEVFDLPIEKETNLEQMSKDPHLSSSQQLPSCNASRREPIGSFAADLECLLNDSDDQWDDDNTLDSDRRTALMGIFKSLYQFLKRNKAHSTIEYLVQACKERGLIKFYAEYNREAVPESLNRRRSVNTDDGASTSQNNEDWDPNNSDGESDFDNNFTMDAFKNQEENLCMKRLEAFRSFEKFSQAGSLGDLNGSDYPSSSMMMQSGSWGNESMTSFPASIAIAKSSLRARHEQTSSFVDFRWIPILWFFAIIVYYSWHTKSDASLCPA